MIRKRKKILDNCKELADYIEKNPNATKDDIKKKLNQAQDIIDPLIEKAESQANLSEYCQNLKKKKNQ